MAFLKAALQALERIAPLRLAESWDNVGSDFMKIIAGLTMQMIRSD